jgi:hypothetical protein
MMPPMFLSGAGLAAGIAWINSIGNLGGFFGPWYVGVMKDLTQLRGWTLWARFAGSDRGNRLRAVSAHSEPHAVVGGRRTCRMIVVALAWSNFT